MNVIEDFSAEDESIAFSGISQLKMGHESKKIYYKDTYGYTPEYTDTSVTKTVYTCYGIRFKGTNQCAAYRWKSAVFDGDTPYLSIKIKALPNKGEGYDVYDITDNYAFWNDNNIIELKIPYTGYLEPNSSTPKALMCGYIMSSTKWSATSNAYYYFGFNQNICRAYRGSSNKQALRLVKVKD